MTLVYAHLSASVDGYVSGRGARAGLGLGDGFRIFDWLSDDSAPNRAVAEYGGTRTGAVVSGRNTYEHADRWGGGSMQPGAPLFVVSRDPIPDAAPGQTVVTDGLESAIRQATAVAGAVGKDVKLAAGAITTGPTLAVLGDNPSGREMVVPLERAEEFGFGGRRGGDVHYHFEGAQFFGWDDFQQKLWQSRTVGAAG